MKTQTWLGGLLALQLLVTGILFIGGNRASEQSSSVNLLDFATADVDRIVIDAGATTATLQRVDSGWQLPDLASLPADASRIDTLLGTLAALRTSWPVVNTASGRERFEVTEDRYQRRLTLYRGEELLGEYFFGTSPGFRQTHGRRAGEEEVYALAINNFDLPGDANDWLDKTLLRAQSPANITGPDFAITRVEEQWRLADDPEGEASALLNQDEVEELVTALGNLRVLRAEEVAAGESVAFEVGTGEGSWRYLFTKAGDKYYVERSDRDQGFTISQTDYERIAGKSRDEIVVTDSAAPVEEEATDEKV